MKVSDLFSNMNIFNLINIIILAMLAIYFLGFIIQWVRKKRTRPVAEDIGTNEGMLKEDISVGTAIEGDGISTSGFEIPEPVHEVSDEKGQPFFKKFLKRKKPDTNVPEPEIAAPAAKPKKVYRTDRIRIFLWGLIFTFLITGIFSIFSGFKALSQASKAEEQIASLTSELADLKELENIDTPATDSFFRRFLNVYFTIDTETNSQEERVEKLKKFNSKLDFKLTTSPEVGQSVVSMRSYGYEKVGDHYVVTYTVETKAEGLTRPTLETDSSENEEDVVDTFVSNVSVAFKKTKNGYAILGMPYQNEYDPNQYVAEKSSTLEPYSAEELEDKETRKELKTFVEQFLTEYQNNNKENLGYLMAKVEGLGGGKKVELKSLKYYGSKKEPVVEANVVINNGETGIGFSENLRLHLTTSEDGKYFIESLEHF